MLGNRHLEKWTVKQVCAFLKLHSLDRYKTIFKKNKVDGRKLSLCKEVRHLQPLGIDIDADALKLLSEINKINGNIIQTRTA